MKYNTFGKTGKKVSAIGFGGMRFPTAGREKTYDYDYCAEMIHEACRLGINYFDTAPYYNDDNSEDIFGHAFRNMPGDFFVSTKCASWKAQDLRKSLENSLRRLNVDKIDFFHIWCVLDMDDYKKRIKPGGPYDELQKARSEGLVDHICISTHCTGDEIAQIAEQGYFEGITLGYNIINHGYRQAGIKAAYENNIAVVTMNPLGGGLIPLNPEYFSYICGADDRSVVESALRFNASHKEITIVLAGMDSIENVRFNASIAEPGENYMHESLNRIEAHKNPGFNALCTGCRYCEPCPSGIPVSKFMLSYNKKILADDKSLKDSNRFHWHIDSETAGECTECGLCEKRCTQHLPVIKRLMMISKF